MERDGSIVRETDPNDRRKTLVRITPQGEQARLQSEQALNDYFARVMARLTPEQLSQMNALRGVLLDAIEAENDAQDQKRSLLNHAKQPNRAKPTNQGEPAND